MRIYYKLIIAFLILSVIPTLIVGVTGFYYAKNSLEESIVSNMHSAANEAIGDIETFIAARKSDMIMLQRQNVYKTTFSMMSQFGNDPSSRYYIEAKNALDAQLAVLQMVYEYNDISLISMQGRIIYTSNPMRHLETDKYIDDAEGLLQKAKSGNFVCDACVGHDKKGPYEICIFGTAYGKDDEAIGLIQLTLDTRGLLYKLNNKIRLGESGEILCAKKGSDNSISFLGELKHKSALGQEERVRLTENNITPIQRALQGESGSGRIIDYHGQDALSVWLPIKSLGWGVVVKIDENEAFSPIDKLRNLLTTTLIFTVFLVVLTALIIAKSITVPIDKLRKGAKIVGLGNFDYRIGISSKDEFGQLSNTFDSMAQNLKKTTASISDLNKEIGERQATELELEKLLKWQKSVNVLQQSLLEPVFLEKKLEMITDGIARIFDADFCRIWLIRPGDKCEKGCIHANAAEEAHRCHDRDKCLHLVASSGRYTHTDGKEHARVPFGCYEMGVIASAKEQKFLTNDATNDPRVHNHEWARALGLVSFAGYQLKIPNGETIGVLALFAKHPILSAEDMILSSFATATALVIQQAITSNNLLKKSVELARSIEELKHSQKMLVQSEKMASLGKLVSEISHEINNPLMIISGNAQLSLMSEKMSADMKNTLNVIMSECQRAKDIIRRVLKFAKPSRGDVKKVNACNTIETVVGIIENPFKTAGRVEIKRKYPKDQLSVLIDEQQLHEVFMNILNNAKDAMPDGGTITITASREDDRVRIDFKDNGQGMSDETKQDIFEPFFTTKSEGTGLGLAISYGIIKAHGGELKFESELNKGTTFTILLPIAKDMPV